MDSLTQIVLGAAVGEATLGKKIGNKALLWGGIAGTVPDLDVLVTDFYSTVDGLFVHRGFSHSILFSLLFAPVLGYLAYRIHRKKPVSWKEWTGMMFLAFFTHILLDTLTSYGTGLFEPFSNLRPELSTIAIVDIFYTLPFFILLVILAFFKKEAKIRRTIIWTAFIISTSYLGFTAINKTVVSQKTKKSLAEKEISYQELKVQPLPLTNFLWMSIARVDSGYYLGYYSNFDDKKPLNFEFIPNNPNIPYAISHHPEVEKLKSFSKGFYHIEPHQNGYYFYDLRFGKMGFKEDAPFIFTFNIQALNERLSISEGEFTNEFSSDDFKVYLNRIKGM